MSWSDSDFSNNNTPRGGNTGDHSIFMIVVLSLSGLFFASFFLQILFSTFAPGADRIGPTHLFNFSNDALSEPCDR